MVSHLIIFNSTAPEQQVRAMAVRAKAILGAIPGVTYVRFGTAVKETTRYRYLFDVGFEDETVIESYYAHPDHIRFAEEEFRPLAPDRITTDYMLE